MGWWYGVGYYKIDLGVLVGVVLGFSGILWCWCYLVVRV